MQCLAISSFEAFDKVFCLLNHFLLLFVLFHLLLAAFFTKDKILRIVHFIVIDTSHGYFDGARSDVIHKLTVVADDNDSLCTCYQKIFQPLYGLDIKMIGRLVKKKDIRILQEQFRQLDAHTPSAAEITGLPVEIFARESQPEQRFFHIFLKMGKIDGIKLLAHGRNFLDKFHIRIALVIGTRSQLIVNGLNLRFHGMKMGKSLRSLLKNRTAVLRHQMLWKISDYTILGGSHFSAGRLTDTRQNLQQGRLACTVLSHQGNTVFLVYLERNVTKQGGSAKLDGQSIY